MTHLPPTESAIPVLTLDLIRHGEPVGGVRYRGSLDDPLSETGWQQLQTTLQRLQQDDQQWDGIISSPLKRCRGFAESTASQLSLPLSVVEDLRELSFGDLEGLTPEQAWQQYPQLLRELWESPQTVVVPNGEPFNAFCDRVTGSLTTLLDERPDRRILMFVHGGVIRALLHRWFAIPAPAIFSVDVPFAAATRIAIHFPSDRSPTFILHWVNRW
jgi:broad specificity phosphatase PhoE